MFGIFQIMYMNNQMHHSCVYNYMNMCEYFQICAVTSFLFVWCYFLIYINFLICIIFFNLFLISGRKFYQFIQNLFHMSRFLVIENSCCKYMQMIKFYHIFSKICNLTVTFSQMSMKKPQSLVSVTKVRLTVFYLETSAHGKKHI